MTASILNPNGSVLAAATCMESSGFIDAQMLAATGTYTIRVEPVGPVTGNLTLTLYNLADFSGTISAGGSAVTVSTTMPGQDGALTFSGTAGQRISLNRTTGRVPGAANLRRAAVPFLARVPPAPVVQPVGLRLLLATTIQPTASLVAWTSLRTAYGTGYCPDGTTPRNN